MVTITAAITGFRNEQKESVDTPAILKAESGNSYINCTFDGAKNDEGVLLAGLPIVQYYGTPEQLKKVVVGQKMQFKWS